MRQLAWLNAVPERPGRRISGEQRVSRLEALRAEDKLPDLPGTDAFYLVQYLLDLGPTVASGMGAAPVGYVEIDAWQRALGIELAPWEAQTLRALSVEYLAMSHRASAHDCAAPYVEGSLISAARRREVANKLDALLGGMRKK